MPIIKIDYPTYKLPFPIPDKPAEFSDLSQLDWENFVRDMYDMEMSAVYDVELEEEEMPF